MIFNPRLRRRPRINPVNHDAITVVSRTRGLKPSGRAGNKLADASCGGVIKGERSSVARIECCASFDVASRIRGTSDSALLSSARRELIDPESNARRSNGPTAAGHTRLPTNIRAVISFLRFEVR
jgi:hypothetical protein